MERTHYFVAIVKTLRDFNSLSAQGTMRYRMQLLLLLLYNYYYCCYILYYYFSDLNSV